MVGGISVQYRRMFTVVVSASAVGFHAAARSRFCGAAENRTAMQLCWDDRWETEYDGLKAKCQRSGT